MQIYYCSEAQYDLGPWYLKGHGPRCVESRQIDCADGFNAIRAIRERKVSGSGRSGGSISFNATCRLCRCDCKACIEGAAVGISHQRVKNSKSYAPSVDLLGPLPARELSRDQ